MKLGELINIMYKCEGCSHKGYACHLIGKILMIIGGINWGLIGVGMLLGSAADWNVVHMLLAGVPVIEAIVYLLVGITAVMAIFGCKCKKCKTEEAASSEPSVNQAQQM